MTATIAVLPGVAPKVKDPAQMPVTATVEPPPLPVGARVTLESEPPQPTSRQMPRPRMRPWSRGRMAYQVLSETSTLASEVHAIPSGVCDAKETYALPKTDAQEVGGRHRSAPAGPREFREGHGEAHRTDGLPQPLRVGQRGPRRADAG